MIMACGGGGSWVIISASQTLVIASYAIYNLYTFSVLYGEGHPPQPSPLGISPVIIKIIQLHTKIAHVHLILLHICICHPNIWAVHLQNMLPSQCWVLNKVNLCLFNIYTFHT